MSLPFLSGPQQTPQIPSILLPSEACPGITACGDTLSSKCCLETCPFPFVVSQGAERATARAGLCGGSSFEQQEHGL